MNAIKMSLVAVTVCLIACVRAEGSEWKFQWPAVVPAVAEHECRADVQVALDADLAVEVTCADGAKGAAWVAEKMSAWFGGLAFAARDVAGAADDLAENPEAYALEAEKGRLVIRARTLKGVRWAMMTLRQIAQPVRGTFGRLAYEVPAFRVKDAPETAFRALHLCAFPEVTIPRLEHGIRMAAYYKFNYVIVESWGVFRSERQPWYGWKDGKLTVAECRRLAAVAQDLGVTLIPFFNVFGHATATRGKSGKNAILDTRPEYQGMFEPVAGFNWCLSNPHVRQVICDLVGELHDAFGRPQYFHLGCDEADPPSCAACCAADYGRLLADHVTALADFVRRRGARPMIWHDMLVKEGDPRWKGFYAHGTDATVSLLDRLPKDVIICDWWYDDPPKDGKYPTLEHFRAKGFTTVTCPWDNVPGIVSQCDYARRNGLGVIGTTWNRFTSYRVWEMYPYSAAGAWSTAAARDVEKVAARYSTFLRDVFGTHWRQVGYDTPGVDTYSEFGYFTDQIGVSIHER